MVYHSLHMVTHPAAAAAAADQCRPAVEGTYGWSLKCWPSLGCVPSLDFEPAGLCLQHCLKAGVEPDLHKQQQAAQMRPVAACQLLQREYVLRQHHVWQAHQSIAQAPVELTEALEKTQGGAAAAPATAPAVAHTAAAGVVDAGAVPRRHGHGVPAPAAAVHDQWNEAAVPGTDACHTVRVCAAAAAAPGQPNVQSYAGGQHWWVGLWWSPEPLCC